MLSDVTVLLQNLQRTLGIDSTRRSRLPVILEDKTMLLFSSVNLKDVIWVRGPPLSDYVNV